MSTPSPYPAFIDSNLDTHLALIVSRDDTVSDLKGKIEKEHQQCFPQFGNIKVHGVKVKRKGYYYHLSDSMTVQSAFYGVSNWFLSVDISSAGDHSQNHQSYNPVCGNLLTSNGINTVALVDGVDHASGLCPKRSSNLDETQLQLDMNGQFVKEKARISDNEMLECKTIEGERSIDNVCELKSPDVNSKEESAMPIVWSLRDRDPEVGNPLSAGIEVSCGRNRENSEYDESLDDKATGKKKRKRKNGMEESIDDHADVDNSICENGVDGSQLEVASKIFQSNIICEKTGIPDELVVSKTPDLLSENPIQVSQYSPASKKAKKGNDLIEREHYLKAVGVSVSEFHESAKHVTISEQSGGSNKRSIKTALGGLSTEPSENVCHSGTSSSRGKKKKKTKHNSSNLSSQVAIAISSPSKDNKGKMSTLSTGIPNTVTREADVIDDIPVYITPDAAVSSFPKISAVEMQYSNVSSIHSSFDVDIRNSKIDQGDSISDAPEKEAVFGIERIINAKDNQTIDAKGATGVTEDVISSQISDKPLPFETCISSAPNEADVIVNEVITSLGLQESKKIDNANSGKKKKKKKSKNCDQNTPFEAVIEAGKGNVQDNSNIRLHKLVSCSVPLSQTMSEEVASMACGTDQNCGVTETILPSLVNENPLPSGICISSEQNGADLTVNEENFKQINGSADFGSANPDRKKKKKNSKSRGGDRLPKFDNEHARGEEHGAISAGPHETVNSLMSSKKATAVEINYSRSPSEEAANAILELTRSGIDDTSVDLVEASQSNGATMFEKKDEKTKKKSKKSSAHDRNGSEALALLSPSMKIPKRIVNHDRKGLEKDASDVKHLTPRKTSVKKNGKVNHLDRGKSLLTKSRRIFRDASSDSSMDGDLVANSDAAVCTPDNSFSSDHSDNESNANINLAQNGSYDLEKKLLDGRNIRNTESASAAKSMTLDRILRSSSRFKKAKITAIESQLEDTNSLPVDMVPDSQPNL